MTNHSRSWSLRSVFVFMLQKRLKCCISSLCNYIYLSWFETNILGKFLQLICIYGKYGGLIGPKSLLSN